jgi:hypothetical protein
MNILISQHNIYQNNKHLKVCKSYTGKCNNLIIIIFDESDIINIDNIKYNNLFVIIAKTDKNVQTLISLCVLIMRCNSKDIYLETPKYTTDDIIRDIKHKIESDHIFWILSIMIFIIITFLLLLMLVVIYKTIYEFL